MSMADLLEFIADPENAAEFAGLYPDAWINIWNCILNNQDRFDADDIGALREFAEASNE